MERWEAKLVAMSLAFVIMFIFGLLPIKVSAAMHKRGAQGDFILSLLTCFGGGAFLGTYLLHMTPEIRHLLEEALLLPHDIHYPLPELFIAVGFFLVAYEEIFVERCLGVSGSSGGHSHSLGVPESQEKSTITSISVSKFDDQPVTIQEKNSTGDKPTPLPEVHVEDVGDYVSEVQKQALKVSHIRVVNLVLALVLECLFEGLAMGLATTTSGVWTMFAAIISHELIMSFCLGLELVKYYRTKVVIISIFFYSLTIPVGAGIGMAIVETQDHPSSAVNITNGILLGLAAGCFIYITFFGILSRELFKDTSRLARLTVVLIGFMLIMGVMAIPHDHHHHHDHEHDDNHTDSGEHSHEHSHEHIHEHSQELETMMKFIMD